MNTWQNGILLYLLIVVIVIVITLLRFRRHKKQEPFTDPLDNGNRLSPWVAYAPPKNDIEWNTIDIHDDPFRGVEKDSTKSKSDYLATFRIFVINLKDTPMGKKRWGLMKKTIFAEKMERFDGIYGRTYDYTDEIKGNIITQKWDYGKWKNSKSFLINMTAGEIGVSLSHYYLWKKIKEENIPQSIILEDDSIEIVPDFEEKFKHLMKKMPSDWDVVLLSFWLHKGNNGKKINKHVTRVRDFVFMNAYVINPRGAKKLLDKLPINMPIDSWVSQQSSDVVIYRHHFQTPSEYTRGNLIFQASKQSVGSSIEHTNNW